MKNRKKLYKIIQIEMFKMDATVCNVLDLDSTRNSENSEDGRMEVPCSTVWGSLRGRSKIKSTDIYSKLLITMGHIQ